MYILNGEQARDADRRTIENVGIPARVLMENAGRAVADLMEAQVPNLHAQRIGILCGKGNNGGDGLVLLRTLANRGCDVRAWVLAPFESISADALGNLQSALKLGLSVDCLTNEDEWTGALNKVGRMEVLVDAILGTGLNEAARGLAARAIEDVNALNAAKVSIDVPSGLSSDTGALPGLAIQADLTVALGAPKVCHYITPASQYCGRIEVADVGIPPEFVANPSSPRIKTVDVAEMRALLPARAATSHKGSFGNLLIVAGSVGKTGAAVMAAEAALRAGVGLVTVATPHGAIPSMASSLKEAMWEPLDETADGSIAQTALPKILKLLKTRSAVAIGPGLGQCGPTVQMVRELIQEVRLPAVVDADGLNALESLGALPPNRPIALTPHPGEAARLLNRASAAVQQNRLDAVRQLATRSRSHVVLKGYRSLVSDAAGNLSVNTTGNPGMATAGSGDILTGVVGAFLAQGLWVTDALRLGVYLHGLAGDLAAEELGETSVIATDIARCLPKAIRMLQTGG